MQINCSELFRPLLGINLSQLNIHVVGGAVRDTLLGITPKDIDYVVIGATPDCLLKLGFRQIGRDFPVFLHPKSHVEVALARTERKTSSGHKGFQIFSDPSVKLETDLERRDFTINAMALSRSGQLTDPFHGYKDLKDRILRHVSKAFSEDPLRVLRGVRFKAQLNNYHFKIAENTRNLMITMIKQLSELSVERINVEIDKILSTDDPTIGLNELESLAILKQIAPEIKSIPQIFYTTSLEARCIEWMSRNSATEDCIKSICNRFKFSNHRKEALNVALSLIRNTSMTPKCVIDTMTRLGWLRGNVPDSKLDSVLMELDRANITPIPIEHWFKYRAIARSVTAKTISNREITGASFGKAIYLERLKVLSMAISAPGTAPGL